MSKQDAYIEKAQAKIEEYSAKLDQLKAQAKSKQADGKIETQKQADQMEADLQVARQKLSELSNTTEENSEDISDRFKTLSNDLETSFRKFFK